jgi:hydroxyacylglutathione hydrolase
MHRGVLLGGNAKLEAVLITGFPTGMFQANCYIAAAQDRGEAMIIDPGQGALANLRRLLAAYRLTPSAVLLTHGHLDHIWTAQKVCDQFGIPAFIHPGDRSMLSDPIRGFGPRIGQLLFGALFSEPKKVVEIGDGDKLELAGTTVIVEHTPGHTRGSVAFRVTADREVVFTGDTLFRNSVGRTDLPGGSGRDLLGSIVEKLLVLDDDTVVLPGHGEATTIGAERRANPFLEGLTP